MNRKQANFGEYFKELRKRHRISLRQFCKTSQADPGNISKMERGLIRPPQDHEILARYASALQITEGSDEWYQLFDLAAADLGIVPKDLMSDAEIIKKLPTCFRTLRGQKPTREELVNLIEKIRSS